MENESAGHQYLCMYSTSAFSTPASTKQAALILTATLPFEALKFFFQGKTKFKANAEAFVGVLLCVTN